MVRASAVGRLEAAAMVRGLLPVWFDPKASFEFCLKVQALETIVLLLMMIWCALASNCSLCETASGSGLLQPEILLWTAFAVVVTDLGRSCIALLGSGQSNRLDKFDFTLLWAFV